MFSFFWSQWNKERDEIWGAEASWRILLDADVIVTKCQGLWKLSQEVFVVCCSDRSGPSGGLEQEGGRTFPPLYCFFWLKLRALSNSSYRVLCYFCRYKLPKLMDQRNILGLPYNPGGQKFSVKVLALPHSFCLPHRRIDVSVFSSF